MKAFVKSTEAVKSTYAKSDAEAREKARLIGEQLAKQARAINSEYQRKFAALPEGAIKEMAKTW